jgi:hypothetical protein
MSKTMGIATAISLLSLLVLQTQLVNASTSNATQAANQTGEEVQAGMSNVTHESESAANQTAHLSSRSRFF